MAAPAPVEKEPDMSQIEKDLMEMGM
jgi:hypothetical protein